MCHQLQARRSSGETIRGTIFLIVLKASTQELYPIAEEVTLTHVSLRNEKLSICPRNFNSFLSSITIQTLGIAPKEQEKALEIFMGDSTILLLRRRGSSSGWNHLGTPSRNLQRYLRQRLLQLLFSYGHINWQIRTHLVTSVVPIIHL